MKTQSPSFAKANRFVTDLILGIFRPLSRILLRHHVPYSRVAQLLKWTYVHEARKQLGKNEGSVSRLALATSLCRKEVGRILAETTPPVDARPRRHERIASITTGWRNDPRFGDPAGMSAVLRLSKGDRSFRSLVETYSTDIGYQTVLGEMLELGIIDVSSDQSVSLNQDGLGSFFVAPDLGVYDCVMFVQSKWSALAGSGGELPPLRIWDGSPCLSDFVKKFSPQFDVQTILDEMKRGHAIVETADGCSVTMNERLFIATNPTSVLQVLANSANHVLRTFDRNLSSPEPERWLQRESRYQALKKVGRERLHAELRTRFEEMKLDLMKEFEPLEWCDRESPRTAGFGIYFFEQEMAPEWLRQPLPQSNVDCHPTFRDDSIVSRG